MGETEHMEQGEHEQRNMQRASELTSPALEIFGFSYGGE
jgi:hypothetical protein